MRGVALLGATGSIGKNTLSVLEHLKGFRLVAVSAHRNAKALLEIARRWKPKLVVLTSDAPFPEGPWQVLRGVEGLVAAALDPEVDILVAGSGGVSAARAVGAALEAGKRVALANKETLVAFGPVIREIWKRSSGELIPVDSEHSALFQLLEGRREEAVRLVITSSGGAFRGKKAHELKDVKPSDALKHPTWRMGAKITIDSATLMNKVLEVIEAHFLFDFPPDKIEVLVHPTSTVHALVELADGSWLAHLGVPDMRIPIQFALTYPERKPSPAARLNLAGLKLEFYEPDTETFRLLPLAWEALRLGGTAPAVLTAANDVAVHAFLEERIGFLDIFDVVERVFGEHEPKPMESFEDGERAFNWATRRAQELIIELCSR